jgi:hypothetical protein
MKEKKRGWACSIHERKKPHKKFKSKNLTERDHLEECE